MPSSPKKTSRVASASGQHKSRGGTIPEKQRRQATVYDAVAGRISSTGFIPTEPRISKFRDTPSSSNVAVPPEELLFRRRGAPVRYEEDDIYWADRHLTNDQTLPESDLLKAIHTYASEFYARATSNKGAVDCESMDETALLGLGILLEEMAGHVLGDTGDLAFVEGEEVDEVEGDVGVDDGSEREEDEAESMSSGTASGTTSDDGSTSEESEEKPRRKRRKIRHGEGDVG